MEGVVEERESLARALVLRGDLRAAEREERGGGFGVVGEERVERPEGELVDDAGLVGDEGADGTEAEEGRLEADDGTGAVGREAEGGLRARGREVLWRVREARARRRDAQRGVHVAAVGGGARDQGREGLARVAQRGDAAGLDEAQRHVGGTDFLADAPFVVQDRALSEHLGHDERRQRPQSAHHVQAARGRRCRDAPQALLEGHLRDRSFVRPFHDADDEITQGGVSPWGWHRAAAAAGAAVATCPRHTVSIYVSFSTFNYGTFQVRFGYDRLFQRLARSRGFPEHSPSSLASYTSLNHSQTPNVES